MAWFRLLHILLILHPILNWVMHSEYWIYLSTFWLKLLKHLRLSVTVQILISSSHSFWSKLVKVNLNLYSTYSWWKTLNQRWHPHHVVGYGSEFDGLLQLQMIPDVPATPWLAAPELEDGPLGLGNGKKNFASISWTT